RRLDLGRAGRTHPFHPHRADPARHRLARLVDGLSSWRGSGPMRMSSRFLCATVLCGSALTLAGCNDGSGDPAAQIGPNPPLPPLQQYLLPPRHIAKVIGWKQGETPKVTQGLKIEPLATGLQHPRSLYTLPNGDVLVVESKAPQAAAIKRPKEIVMG